MKEKSTFDQIKDQLEKAKIEFESETWKDSNLSYIDIFLYSKKKKNQYTIEIDFNLNGEIEKVELFKTKGFMNYDDVKKIT